MYLFKKITAVVLLIVLMLSMMGTHVFADDSSVANSITVEPLSGNEANRLHALGIITDGDIENGGERFAVRGEFVAWVIRLIGLDPNFGTQVYTDVTAETENSAYINTAYRINLISEAEFFNPDSYITFAEACKITLAAVGYDVVARENGGYPNGYTTTAAKFGFSKGIGTTGSLKVSDAVCLLDNTLDANVLDYNYNDVYSLSDKTVLSEYLHIDKITVQIDEVFVDDHQIRATSDGLSSLYNLDNSIDTATVIEDEAELYITTDSGRKKVVYIDYKGKISVEYDYIAEVNESPDGKKYQTNDIKKIRLSNSDKEYRMDSSAKVTFNDSDAALTPIILTDAFAKVVIKSGKVVRIDAYSLYEGGIIYHSDPEMIKFIRGDVSNNVMERLDTIDEFYIYLDGVRVDSMYRLKSDMLFDYYISPDEEKMIIAASSRIYSKTLESVGNGYVIMDGVKYDIDLNKGLYVYSNSRERYQKDGSLKTYLGKQVNAFVDDNMYIRYIKVSDDIEYSDSFLGVLMAVSNSTDAFDDNGKLKIFKITGGQGEKIYETEKKKMDKSPIKMDYLRAYAGNTQGKSFLRFTLNKENRITKVEPVDLWGSTTSFTGTVEKTNDGWLGSLYARTATIFAGFINDNGNFEVRVLDWEANMRDFTFLSQVTVISDYDALYNPKPSYIMLGEGSESHRSRGAQTGIIKEISYIEDDKARINIGNMWGDKSYVVTDDFISSNGLRKNLLIEWYYDLFTENPISIHSKRDLTGDPDSWSVDNGSYTSGTTNGFYRADTISYRDTECVQFMVNGEPSDLFPLNQYVIVYEVQYGKHGMEIVQNTHNRPIGFISPGDKVWFHVVPYGPDPRSVDMIIYEKTSIAGN